MAEGLLRYKLQTSLSLDNWLVASAGTWTPDGLPALSGVIGEMASRGIDISQHRSQQVNKSLLDSYHLILTMDKNQQEALCVEFPQAAGRIHLLTEMVGENWEVLDYDGLGMARFDLVAKDIASLVDRGFDKIQELAQED